MPDRRPTPDEYAPHQEPCVSLVDGLVLDVLRAQESEIATLPTFISEAKAAFRYAPNKWSIRQVLAHLFVLAAVLVLLVLGLVVFALH